MSEARATPSPAEILDAIVRITKVIGTGRSLEAIFDAVADELSGLLTYDRCSVALLDPDGETVTVTTHRGRLAEPLAEGRRPIAGTLVGQVIARRGPLIHDVDPEDRFVDDDARRRLGIVRVVAVPLIVDGEPVGAFGLSSATPGALGPEHVRLLETIADHLALAIAATNLRRDAERRAERAQFLAGTAAAFAASLDLDRRLHEAVHRAADVLGDLNAIFLLDEETGQPHLRALGHPDPAREALARREEVGSASDAAAILEPAFRGTPLLVARLTPDRVSPAMRAVVDRLGLRSVVAVPLVVRDRVIGALCSCWTDWPGRRSGPEAAGPEDLALAQDVATQIAGAVENARLFAAARRAIAERDAFLAAAAHELRTPLTTLRGRTQLLQRRLADRIDPTDRDSLRVSLRQIDRLGRTVNDLLEIARIDADRLVLVRERCDLVALAREAVAEQAAAEDRIGLVAEEERVVGHWDPWRLEQVLANLLSNALRYTPPGTPVTVRVRREDDWAVLSVSDRGMGIEAQDLERIFERFYRGGRTERAGFGLGLAICRRIVADHGGRLWAESPGPGQGATFTMTLPLTEARGVRRE